MKAVVFYSGSKGNCAYFSHDGTSILIDAGGTFKRIKECLARAGSSLDALDAIFVTHEHTDHTKALKQIAKRSDVKIFTTLETARAFCSPTSDMTLDECRLLASSVMTIKPQKTYEIGSFSVRPFQTSHDTECSLGFAITTTDDRFGVGYATDLGVVTDGVREGMRGMKNIFIESNHDLDMLKNGPYPEHLKVRISSERGHLSNSDSAAFSRELFECGARSFTLLHLSEENNRPDIAREVFREALGEGDYALTVASPYEICSVECVEN